MKSLTRILVMMLVTFGTVATKVYAQEENKTTALPVILIDEQDEYPLGLHLELLEDPGGQLTFEDVTASKYASQFVPSQAEVPNLGFTNSAIWIRFRVKNESVQTQEWRLHYSRPTIHHIEFYLPQPDDSEQSVQVIKTGSLHPFESRDVPSHQFVFKLPLPSTTDQTVYLRLKSEAALSVPLTLWHPDSFAQQSNRGLFGIGTIFGIYLVMAGYNLFIGLFLKEKSYLYYVLFVLAMLTFQIANTGIGSQYLWPSHAWLNQYMIPISVAGNIVFSLLFAVTFLQTKTQTPKQHKFINLLLLLCGLVLLQFPFFPYFLVIRQLTFLAGVTFAVLLLVGFTTWRKRYKPARYYLLAWSAILITVILLSASSAGLLPYTSLTQQSQRPSTVLLVLLLPLALADRINFIRQERATARAAALQAAQENERLVREQNIFLEQQVAERTEALAQSNQELIAAKDDAEEAQQAAEAANQAKSTFLANMSHELRTPLNGILGFAQILQRDATIAPHQHQQIGTIERSGKHLLILINDVLDIAKIEVGKVSLNPIDIYLPTFFKSIADIIQIRAEQKGLTFYTDFADDLPAIVKVDELRLRQVLINLLGNAVKFTDKGRVTFKVKKVGTAEPRDRSSTLLRFSIEDTGIGIPEKEQEKIFQPFHQVLGQIQQQDGTGLGLSISQHLTYLMDSTIQVKSVLGQGSTFWFDIELAPSAESPAVEPPTGMRIVGYKGTSRTILVVDDDEINRVVLRDILAPLEFNVIEAEDGQQGLEMVARYQPDLILIDIRMPRMDGLEMVSHLRRQEQFKETPVIGVSASAYDEDQTRSIAAGCNNFLPKPIDLENLLRCIEIYLHLDWVYDNIQTIDQTDINDPEESMITFPPQEILEKLEKPITIGDVSAIQTQLSKIEDMNEAYHPFVIKARQMVQQYRIDALHSFLVQAMNN